MAADLPKVSYKPIQFPDNDHKDRIWELSFEREESTTAKFQDLTQSDLDKVGKSCSFCYDNYLPSDLIKLFPCKRHGLHEKCIDEYTAYCDQIDKPKTCPFDEIPLSTLKAAKIFGRKIPIPISESEQRAANNLVVDGQEYINDAIADYISIYSPQDMQKFEVFCDLLATFCSEFLHVYLGTDTWKAITGNPKAFEEFKKIIPALKDKELINLISMQNVIQILINIHKTTYNFEHMQVEFAPHSVRRVRIYYLMIDLLIFQNEDWKQFWQNAKKACLNRHFKLYKPLLDKNRDAYLRKLDEDTLYSLERRFQKNGGPTARCMHSKIRSVLIRNAVRSFISITFVDPIVGTIFAIWDRWDRWNGRHGALD